MTAELERSASMSSWYLNLWATHTILMIFSHILAWVVIGIHCRGMAYMVFGVNVPDLPAPAKKDKKTDDDGTEFMINVLLPVVLWPFTALIIVIKMTAIAYKKGSWPAAPIVCQLIHFILYWIGWVFVWSFRIVWTAIVSPLSYLYWAGCGYNRKGIWRLFKPGDIVITLEGGAICRLEKELINQTLWLVSNEDSNDFRLGVATFRLANNEEKSRFKPSQQLTKV